MSDSEIIKNLNIKENELKKYVILRVYKDSKKKKNNNNFNTFRRLPKNEMFRIRIVRNMNIIEIVMIV